MNAFALMIARGQLADAVLDDGQLVCLLNDEPLCRLQLQTVDTHHLRLLGTIPALPGLSPDCLLPALAQLFCRQGALQTVSLQLAVDADFARQAVRSGVASQWLADGSLLCSRAAFWQHSRLWLTQPSSAGMPLGPTKPNGEYCVVGSPSSISVGVLGKVGRRFSVHTFSATIRPWST